MSIQTAGQLHFDFFQPLPIVIEVSNAPLSRDAGLLLLRQFDERIGRTRHFAAALHDPGDPEQSEHSFLEMVRMRIYGILADYEDQNDHDTLRSDPVFKLIAGRSPADSDLASQPTLSRSPSRMKVGYLESDGTPPPGRLRRAMAYGTVFASLTVEDFGLNRLLRTDRGEIDQRLETYRNMLAF